MEDTLGAFLGMAGFFGGISLLVWVSAKAKVERIKAERQMWQQPSAQPNDPVLTELKALKQQIGEIQNTSHQFDIAFDAAINRLEERVSRIETKQAATRTTPAVETDHLQNGTR